uniref:Sterile alpha motif domain-containing protein 9-like n=1 Tax=Myripristis murdjan TaxID=586833 RepID=A0A667YGV9_9TELE
TGGQHSEEADLSADIKDWSKHQVRLWALKKAAVDDKFADILFQQDINGSSLLLLDKTDLMDLGVTLGPAKLIIHARDELLKFRKEHPPGTINQSGGLCKPYPFQRYHDACRYMENSILDVPESGASDYIEPCHEFKGFISVPDENKMCKFTTDVIRFAAACMNSRTNGTIHFGVGDKPDFTHGEVLGVDINDKEAYEKELKNAIENYFEHKHEEAAKKCIKPPRFVGVLNKDMTSSQKYVIEVDIVPNSTICEENRYFVSLASKKGKKKAKGKETDPQQSKFFYIRDGSSTRNLFPSTTSAGSMEEFNKFVDSVAQLSQLRKQAEEKHLKGVKSTVQGSRLSQMITGGTQSLDQSHFEQYVIVTNKSHPGQLESLTFLQELNPAAVLDFDPESTKNGLQQHFEELSTVNVHLPIKYKITEGVEDIASKLKLTRNTSWVLCNGGVEDEVPSDIENWLIEKGASVRDVISFLCRKDVLPSKRFLVVFLLLSTVSEKMDPLVETFSIFWQELKGTEQILCICENEKAFTYWKDLIEARCGTNISRRCIYDLSFAEVNGTILSLLSENRRSKHFLPCGGGSKVLFEKKVERSLNTLDVLCVNQCEGGNENKIVIEENFYKGGKVSWWNFFFSEQPGSTPFIKRDQFDFIMNTVIPDLSSLRKACVLFSLMHVPGCGGTTLAMHTLWAHKDKFRCAVLKDSNADLAEVATQVVKLLRDAHEEQLPRVPVLLMIDDFEDMDKVFDLQQLIEKECVTHDIQSGSPQVILLNCMRSDSSEQTETTEETVFIGNKLSEKEQKQCEQKLKEIEKTHKENLDTFYGFMIMKKNFSQEYIQGVARNTLKSFNINHKHAQLIAVLALLNVYCKGASLSVSLCEEFLGLQPKALCGSDRFEDGFGSFSTLISAITVEAKVVFKAVKMIHSSIAQHCLQELATTHNVQIADIANLLLTTDRFYESTQGKDSLMQNVRCMLVKRYHSKEEESTFSPLIQDIAKQSQGLEEIVLLDASKRFERDAIISQLLARYYYLKKRDFKEAKDWARRAKDLNPENSYITDTSAQVIKHELKNAIAEDKELPFEPEKVQIYLKMARSAMDAFKEQHNLAKKESMQRFQNRRDMTPFNTAGCLGEIQVGVIVIEILEKTHIFSTGSVRHDIMSGVLSGDLTIQKVEEGDRNRKNKSYYSVLRQFEDILCTLKERLKLNFDFLDKFYVNLGSRCGMKDTREQIAKIEFFRCFKQYADLFCKTDSTNLNNKTMNVMLKVHSARRFLEMQKADTYYGVLDYLSNQKPTEVMEKIAKTYDFLQGNGSGCTLKEKINFIYANVVLSCIKPHSLHLKPFKKLCDSLGQILGGQISSSERLPLHFIAVALFWPQPGGDHPASKNLGKFVSWMRTLYDEDMQGVCNGKRPVVHFLLGKKYGYERMVHLEEIRKCVKAGQEQFATMWANGTIWKEKQVEQLLFRVSGVVQGRCILADTSIPDLKVEVGPMFRSQLSGRAKGSKVSFFIGFSVKGPLAIDIN